jgi:hypothetical protein
MKLRLPFGRPLELFFFTALVSTALTGEFGRLTHPPHEESDAVQCQAATHRPYESDSFIDQAVEWGSGSGGAEMARTTWSAALHGFSDVWN